MTWYFSASGVGTWAGGLDAAPSESAKTAFWELAVERFAFTSSPPPSAPRVVVCHVTAPARGSQRPGGPRGRPKMLLDALHDDRRSGPKYGDTAGTAPLPNDKPEFVSGLAVEVRPGVARTDYFVGSELAIAGERLASIAVGAAAPNDIAGTTDEGPRIAKRRVMYGKAVREAFASYGGTLAREARALVVRHHPQRDEDNTWGDLDDGLMRLALWRRGSLGSKRADARAGNPWPLPASLTPCLQHLLFTSFGVDHGPSAAGEPSHPRCRRAD